MNAKNNINSSELGELLTSYYQGKLSKEEVREFEELAAEDQFLSEAMEGYREFPSAINSIPKFSTSTTLKFWVGGISLGVLLVIAGVIFFTEKGNSSTTKTSTLANFAEESSIIESKVKVENLVVSTKDIPHEPAKKTQQNTDKKNNRKEEVSTVIRESFIVPKIDLSDLKIREKKTDYTLKKAKTKALAYYNFLAVDYSVIYVNEISNHIPLTGIDASKSNGDEEGVKNLTEEEKKEYTYKEFLKQSLFFLKERNYKKAIENFETIISQYPADVNAEFYLGYAYFNLEKYKKAIPYFDKTMNNGFDFFYEDAQWFKAQSFESLGNFKEAQRIYREVKRKGGYYSFQLE